MSENSGQHPVISDKETKQVAQQKRGDATIHVCKQCHKTFANRQNLHIHKKSVHEGIKYACDKCTYQATQQSSLTRHFQSIHDKSVRYTCDQCEFQTARQSSLIRHVQSVHKEVRFSNVKKTR